METKTYPGGLVFEKPFRTWRAHLTPPKSGWTLSEFKALRTSIAIALKDFQGHTVLIQTPAPVPSSVQKLLDGVHAIPTHHTEAFHDPSLVLACYVVCP